jgi:hypothetical protein
MFVFFRWSASVAVGKRTRASLYDVQSDYCNDVRACRRSGYDVGKLKHARITTCKLVGAGANKRSDGMCIPRPEEHATSSIFFFSCVFKTAVALASVKVCRRGTRRTQIYANCHNGKTLYSLRLNMYI